jgi:hypothetical protein
MEYNCSSLMECSFIFARVYQSSEIYKT